MLRFQASWLLESVNEIDSVESVFFPVFHWFSAFSWLSRREISLSLNSPIDSQAMLARAWVACQAGGLSEKNRGKFNQKLQNQLEADANPFRSWKDRLFDARQLDYLFYWREAAYEIEDVEQREIFWSLVYHIMSYWLATRKFKPEGSLAPDEMMDVYINRHRDFLKGQNGHLEVFNLPLADLVAPRYNSLTVFPLIFDDDESAESELQAVFHAWYHGHDDFEAARRELKTLLRPILLTIGGANDCTIFSRLASQARMAAITWSGRDLPPKLYEQELVEPFRKEFAAQFRNSRLFLKNVDRSADAYDYLLIFHN